MLVLLKHLRVRSPLHWRHLIRVALVVQVLIRRQGLGLWSQGVLLTHGRVGVGHIKIWIRSQCRPRNAARPTDRTRDAALVAGLIRGGAEAVCSRRGEEERSQYDKDWGAPEALWEGIAGSRKS